MKRSTLLGVIWMPLFLAFLLLVAAGIFVTTCGYGLYWLGGGLKHWGSACGWVVRHALQFSGPTGIKAGQLIAGRPDLFGKEFARQLAPLQEDVRAMSLGAARSQIRRAARALGWKGHGSFYEVVGLREVTELIAGASVASVFKALDSNGAVVAVKVLRRWIRMRLAADTAVLLTLGWLVEKLRIKRGLRPRQQIKRLCALLLRQSDLRIERDNMIKVLNAIAEGQHSGDICVPAPKMCTRDVLVMEYVGGISGREAVDDAQNATQSAGAHKYPHQEMGTKLIKFFLAMLFRRGGSIVHGDQHLGNFKLVNGKIALIDFGIIGTLDENAGVIPLATCMAYVAAGVNASEVAFILKDMSPVPAKIRSYDEYVRDITKLIHDVRSQAGAGGDMKVGELLIGLMRVLEKHMVFLNEEFLAVNNAILVAEGGARELAKLDLVTAIGEAVQEYFLDASEENQFALLPGIVAMIESGSSNVLSRLSQAVSSGRIKLDFHLDEFEKFLTRVNSRVFKNGTQACLRLRKVPEIAAAIAANRRTAHTVVDSLFDSLLAKAS